MEGVENNKQSPARNGTMRFKDYSFTTEEMYALRDALVEEYHRVKERKPTSERGRRRLAVLEALKSNFVDAVRLMPEGE